MNLQWLGFGGKTVPFPTVRVIQVVRPVVTVRFWFEPHPEPSRQFGPVANTVFGVCCTQCNAVLSVNS